MRTGQKNVYVTGSGAYLPGDPIPFESINTVLGNLTDASVRIQSWLDSTQRIMSEILDIKAVHYAFDPHTRNYFEDNVTMSVKAAKSALNLAGMSPGDIDLICYGSAHQDQMPTASVRIQDALGIECCDEFSIHANCTSAYKALYIAYELISSGRNRNALVLSSSISSSELRAEYYNQALVDKDSLFLRWFLSDGAGALVLSSRCIQPASVQIEFCYIESIGGKRKSLMYNGRPAYWLNPREEYEKGLHHLKQTFRNALSSDVFQEQDGSIFFNGFKRMIQQGKIPIDRVKFLQINMPARHIIESVMAECTQLGIHPSALYTQIDSLGYCGPPMVFICLDKILREETFRPGDRVVSFVTEVSKFMQAGYSLVYTSAGNEESKTPGYTGALRRKPNQRTAFVFPGIGIAFCGNERHFYNKHRHIMADFFNEASETAGTDLSLCLTESARRQLPALAGGLLAYAFSAGMYHICLQAGLRPYLAAGHSLGIYAAAYAAGSISFTNGITIIQAFDTIVKERCPDDKYGMAYIIGLTKNDVCKIINSEDLSPIALANTNNATSFVLSGERKDLQHVIDQALNWGAVKAALLDIHMPYHHPGFLKNLLPELDNFLQTFEWHDPTFPIVSSIDQSLLCNSMDVRQFIAHNLVTPIAWHGIVELFITKNISQVVECGPGIALTQNARFIEKSPVHVNVKNITRKYRL